MKSFLKNLIRKYLQSFDFAVLSTLPLIFLILASSPLHANRPHKDYSFSVRQFTTLRVQDNVNVIYSTSPDSISVIKYSAPEEFEDAFIFTQEGDVLKIQVTTEDVGKTDLPTIHVSSNKLNKIENYSDFNVTVEETGRVEKFVASLIGNGIITINLVKAKTVEAKSTAGRGTIILQGECDKAFFRITGSGSINAENLYTDNLECKIFGGGSIFCPILKNLYVKGVGSTKIFYRGEPAIKHSGGGRLFQMD